MLPIHPGRILKRELTARALKLPVTYYDPEIHYKRDAGSWIGTGNLELGAFPGTSSPPP